MKTLACDFATVTGWALGADGKILCSGTESFKPKRGDSPGFRWILFSVRFGELLDEQKPTLLVYEQPFIATMKSATVAEVAFGMVTRAQEACEKRGIEYRAIANSTIKQWATGVGNANKDAMIAAAVAKWSTYSAAKDPGGDEADALHLLSFAMAGFPVMESVTVRRAREKREAKALQASATAAAEQVAVLRCVTAMPGLSAARIFAMIEGVTLGAWPTAASVKRALLALEAEGAIRREERGWVRA